MPISDKLLQVARAEWQRWGFSTRPLHGAATIGGTEKQPPFVSFVNDYWVVVGHPNWNGNTPEPWSAAFISFCFKQAGAGKGFPYNPSHVGYCSAILRTPAKFPGLSFEDPATTKLELGDLVFASRRGGKCSPPPRDHAAAVATLKSSGAFFCSHADIVVALRPGEVDVIGGNVSDSVTMSTYAVAGGKIVDPRHNWLGVVKNRI
jgi:hypothetical protein